MGSQWTGMAKALMAIPAFADSLRDCAEALKPLDFDLMNLLLSDDKEELKKNVTNPFVAITAMQIALYDLLCLLDIQYEGVIGHSFGEVGCAYADGCLTRRQAILTAYWRGKIVETARLPKGMSPEVCI
jgi:fatty acid synthase